MEDNPPILKPGQYSLALLEAKTGIICNHHDGEYRINASESAFKVFDNYSEMIFYIKLKLEEEKGFSFLISDEKGEFLTEWR